MTHREKVNCLIEDLRERGVGASTVAPPLFRLLWALGLEVPPPLLMGFVPLTLLMGFLFGFFWGLFMALFFLVWQFLGDGFGQALAWERIVAKGLFVVIVVAPCAALAGLLFGLTMAVYMRWKSAQLGLPSWDRYPLVEPGDDYADDF
jgi:hypothetical protein